MLRRARSFNGAAPVSGSFRAMAPDLLRPSPADATPRIDLETTRVAMGMAFASGVSGGLFADALDRADVSPSTWSPDAYAADLFVTEFVARCMTIGARGAAPLSPRHVARVLTRPPSDPAEVAFRRAILAELAASPERKAALEELYLHLLRFRALLEGAAGAGKWDPARRQLDILALVKVIVDAMATGFAGATSGLSRLAAFGERVRAGEPYRSLGDLLRYDEELATVDLRVSVGADGRIRGFSILSVKENRENPFVASAPRRWAARLELFLRGYKLGEGEVMARLVDAVWEGVEPDVAAFVPLLGDLEVYLGALGMRDRALAAGLSVCLPDAASPGAPRALEGLWNPLLLGHGITPVPCDLRIDRHDAILLVTGPNSGGKTRLLQSIGLTQMLAQAGLFVPARSATVAAAPALVVSLIQDTKADQTEGRLGMELVRIRALFERLPPGAMVILDELCSGTNPSEGEEIFELVVRMLARLSPQALITTHFLAFADRLEREGAVAELRFVQVALGPDHEPTYQFAPGVAKTSLAGHAAARLGVTGDQLLALIEGKIAARPPPGPPER